MFNRAERPTCRRRNFCDFIRKLRFADFGDAGINAVAGNHPPPDELPEVSKSCAQLLDAIFDETMNKIVLLKFQGATNGEVASELNCTERTIERIWIEARLHDGHQ